MEAVPDSESEGYEVEVESMTGKGISRLCSELLELKRASDEDLHKNICSNYSAFLRIFEEVGGIENEIMKMENHISTQKILVEELIHSFHPEIILGNFENIEDECVEELDLEFPSWLETRVQHILETLDILMSEHRLEEALVILEKGNKALQKLRKEKDSLFPIISPFACAISYWRIRLAEQFTSLAENKRVTWPELHNALFGLLRLGESDRASKILLNFFHLQLQNRMNELKCLTQYPHGTYVLELTKVVFFTIIQASRSYVLLFGETYPYTSDIMQWARTELEVICHSFDMHVKSLSETSSSLDLAIETMSLSFSFCSLLEHERLNLLPEIVKLMKPCITEVLLMHFDQLRKVVSLFATTDNWALGKLLVSEKLSNRPSIQNIKENLEYVWVTSSGRKFITLMQMVLDDAFHFRAFHFENPILGGLSGLFDVYINTLERAMTVSENVEECDFPMIILAQKLQQQISVLVNSSELLHLLPILVQDLFNSTIFASDVVLSEQDKFFSLKELDLWKLGIQEISDRVKICFRRLFVSGIMCYGNSESLKELDTCSCGHCIPGSSECPMPSSVFQELFMWLRHLEKQFESMMLFEGGMLNSLINEIMVIVFFLLSENWEFLRNTKCHKQLFLDIHFLTEIAQAGDYYSDNLMAASLDLLRIMKLELSAKELHLSSEITEEEWALNAAKMAIRTLDEANIAESDSKCNPSPDFFSNQTNDGSKGDTDSVHPLESSRKRSHYLQNSVAGAAIFNYDNDGSGSPTICNTFNKDELAGTGTDAIRDKCETAGMDEVNVDDFITILAEDIQRDSAVLGSSTYPREIKGLTGTDESERNSIENQLLGVNPELDGNVGRQNGCVNISGSTYLDGEKLCQG